MITLPASPAPNDAQPHIIEFDIQARPSTGAAVQPIFRPGSRFAFDVAFPAMKPNTARAFTSRLLRARRAGLEIKVPLLGVSQGNPGSPVVDGDYPSGTVLPLRGVTPGHLFGEGYWLSLIDAEGTKYLHSVVGDFTADGAGEVVLSIETPIRAPFPDGATVEAATPTIQGLIAQGSLSLGRMGVNRLIEGIGFTIEEAA